MKIEEKDLLLKDLCCRIIYGVKCTVYKDTSVHTLSGVLPDNVYNELYFRELDWKECNGLVNVKYCKPYLFPLSSMTEEQCKELRNLIHEHFTLDDEFNEGIRFKTYGDILVWLDEKPINECYFIFDYFNKNHFDYRGLIEKSIALDATNLGIYE